MFWNVSNSDRNCEFLKDVSTEKPELLLKDEDYDYYILLSPNGVSIENFFYKIIFFAYLIDEWHWPYISWGVSTFVFLLHNVFRVTVYQHYSSI